MKKLLLLLFVLALMSCGQKQEVTEEAPAVKQPSSEASMDTTAMDTTATTQEAPEEQ